MRDLLFISFDDKQRRKLKINKKRMLEGQIVNAILEIATSYNVLQATIMKRSNPLAVLPDYLENSVCTLDNAHNLQSFYNLMLINLNKLLASYEALNRGLLSDRHKKIRNLVRAFHTHFVATYNSTFAGTLQDISDADCDTSPLFNQFICDSLTFLASFHLIANAENSAKLRSECEAEWVQHLKTRNYKLPLFASSNTHYEATC